MAKILSSTSMTGNISKVIELPDEYIINGHVYDKNTFGPKPLEFCPVANYNNDSIWHNTVALDCSYVHNRTRNNVLIDSNDPTISYTSAMHHWGTGDARYHGATVPIHRFRRTAAGVEQTAIGAADNYPVYHFISQNVDRVFVLANRRGGTDGHFSYQRSPLIFAINKSTLAVELPGSLNGTTISRAKILRDTPGFIYYCVTGNANTLLVGKYNKTTGAVTTLLNDTRGGWAMWQMVSDLVVRETIDGATGTRKTIGTFWATRDGFYKPDSAGNHFNCFRKYVIDLDTEIVTASDVNLDTTMLGPIPFATIFDNTAHASYDVFMHEDAGKRYMNLTVYDLGLEQNNLNPDACALYTFLMNDDDNWKLVSQKKFKPIMYKGMLPMFSNKLLLFGNVDGIAFFNWNTATQSFERTAYYPMPVRQFGSDMNNNIWIQRTNKSVEILTNTLPIDVYADFVKDEYQYDSVDIASHVEVYARNYQGQYLTSTMELTLVGPVVFTDTGSKKRMVTTSNLNKLQIPVTITGTGMLSVNVKLL